MDVSNTFLHGDLTDIVYIVQPQGYIDKAHLDFVYKFHKLLYGLKQAPRAWFHKLSGFLQSFGFTSSHSNSSLFIDNKDSMHYFILIYVDEIIITGNNNAFL